MIINTNNYRRRRTAFLSGMGDIIPGSVNPTTIWSPSTGFLAKPGDITSGSGGPGIYQAPQLLGAPACSSSPDANTADSPECIALLLANQQHDMGVSNMANFSVDEQTCNSNWALNDARYASLGLNRPPNNCSERTFGLTPVGGFTGGVTSLVPNAQQFITGIAPTIQPTPQSQVPVVPATATPIATNNQVNTKSPATQTQQMSQAITVGGQPISDLFSASASIAGFDIPYWALGIGALGLLFVVGGRH